MKYMLTWNWKASCEWVSCKSLITTADWTVVNNFTACVQATCTRTWIYTFLVHTGSVLCTFWAHNTLRSTAWWTANISRQARTHTLSIYLFTLTVRPTWRWTAGITGLYWHSWIYLKTKHKKEKIKVLHNDIIYKRNVWDIVQINATPFYVQLRLSICQDK